MKKMLLLAVASAFMLGGCGSVGGDSDSEEGILDQIKDSVEEYTDKILDTDDDDDEESSDDETVQSEEE
jgi:hypothetical protein